MPALDGLRGVASLLVLLSHTSNAQFYYFPSLNFSGVGKSGVFLFFLLSAFLLSMPLLESESGIFRKQRILRYWHRRIVRIYPTFTLYLLLALLSSSFFSYIDGYEGKGLPFYLDLEGFWSHFTLQQGEGVTWSIGVEFKFYFLLPFIALFIKWARFVNATFAVFVIVAICIYSQLIIPQSEVLQNDTRVNAYMPVFAFGVLLGLIQTSLTSCRCNPLLEWVIRISGYIGILGIIIMTPSFYSFMVTEVEYNYFHNQIFLHALLWALVILSSVNIDGIVSSVLQTPILRFLGKISFGVYLYHPIFITILLQFKLNEFLSAWLILLATIATATISYHTIEQPMNKIC